MSTKGDKWKSPISQAVKPVSKLFLEVDKKVIQKVAQGTLDCKNVKTVVKGGMFHDNTSDDVAGAICLILSLLMLCLALIAIIKILNVLFLKYAKRTIKNALNYNDYIMMVIGAGVTFIVQSSSITTSVLVPLVGVGAIEVSKAFPIVLGANIGTTGTALIASFVSGKDEAVQIALCHLFFNIIGILIWFPIPFMRKVPTTMAETMGWVAARVVWFPIAYLLFSFALTPAVLIGVSEAYESGTTGGVIAGILLTLLILGIAGGVGYWTFAMGGKQKTVDWIEQQGQARLDKMKEVDSTPDQPQA